jgi:hypothetical protein
MDPVRNGTTTCLGAALRALRCTVVAAALLLAIPGVARAQGGEEIDAYHVAIAIQKDGSLEVREVIDYDFGFNQRHGIIRNIPVRFPYSDRFER